MTDAEFLIKLISDVSKQSAQSIEPSIVVGTVTGVNPLKIKFGDEYEIDEDFMWISSHCRRCVAKIPTNESVMHLHEIDAETELAKTDGELNPGTGGASWVEPLGHKHSIKIKTKTSLPEILLWRGVRVGDSVVVLRIHGGSIHYVLDRIDGISNDGSKTKDDETIDEPEKEEQR